MQFVCYIGFAKVNAAPPINLPMRAGEVLHALRTALDYTAFQIYLAGGGTPTGRTRTRWRSRSSPTPPSGSPWSRGTCPALGPPRSPNFGRCSSSRHQRRTRPRRCRRSTRSYRGWRLWAAPTSTATSPCSQLAHGRRARWTEPQPWYATVIQIALPGPVLPTTPGPKVEVSRVFVQPDPAPDPDAALTWNAGVDFERPDPPELSFGFRANDGTEIDARELPAAIDVVESILDRFATLTGP